MNTVLEKERIGLFDNSDWKELFNSTLSESDAASFLKLAIKSSPVLSDLTTVTSATDTWEEGNNKADNLNNNMMVMKSQLFTIELPISDEIIDANSELDGFSYFLINEVPKVVGSDMESYMFASDVRERDFIYDDSVRSDYSKFNGWLRLTASGKFGSNTELYLRNRNDGLLLNCYDFEYNYAGIFRSMLALLPEEFKQDRENMRFYVPRVLLDNIKDVDSYYDSVRIMPVDSIPFIENNSSSYIMLAHRSHLCVGYKSWVKFRYWRDPRQGTSTIYVHLRFVPAVIMPEAVVLGKNVRIKKTKSRIRKYI